MTQKLHHDIVIIGAGASGIAVCASLLRRKKNLDISIIEPTEIHYYQPGWTMVGAGVFKPHKTVRTVASLIPPEVKWIKAAVTAFNPGNDEITLNNGQTVSYKYLVACPGLQLDWHKIKNLEETLGRNGVTSNYRYDLAPYTWECVQKLKKGKAVFTQPPLPIKCAGAPQKAMYLSSDYWLKHNVLNNIDVSFYNAGQVIFAIKEYVPALMQYVERYNAHLHFSHNLVKVDGPNKTAWFEDKTSDTTELHEVNFDMLHVVPPQSAPEFIKSSPLADKAGWVDVDQCSLQHATYKNIYSLGDVTNAPNAKTAAAARVQAPIVANNILYDMEYAKDRCLYNGYGSCPLTVERGKIVLAEFGYGGKILNTFPTWLLNGTKATRRAWFIKESVLPPLYWSGMLKGYEFLAKTKELPEHAS